MDSLIMIIVSSGMSGCNQTAAAGVDEGGRVSHETKLASFYRRVCCRLYTPLIV
jgi:hypothetical protein